MVAASLLFAALTLNLTEREIAFRTPDGLELHGTFAIPAGQTKGAKDKALLLIPGSGPTDRNGNQPGLLQADTLKELAEKLADAGIASFRFDKRATRSNAGLWPKDLTQLDAFFSFENQVADAAAALDTLRKQPEVDIAHVGIAGHSEGGLIAMILGTSPSGNKPAGLALLSTAGRPLEAVLTDQIGALLARQTSDPAVRQQYLTNLKESLESVEKTGTKPANVLPGLAGLFSPGTSKYWQSILKLDPAKILPGYDGNVLVVQGEKDSQVSAEKDFPVLKAAVKAGHSTLALVPGASHNLKSAEHPADAGVAGPIVPAAVKTIVDWATTKL